MENDSNSPTVRFTRELPRDLVEALDAYRTFLADRAEDVTKTKCRVSRNAALDGLLRPQLFPEGEDPA